MPAALARSSSLPPFTSGTQIFSTRPISTAPSPVVGRVGGGGAASAGGAAGGAAGEAWSAAAGAARGRGGGRRGRSRGRRRRRGLVLGLGDGDEARGEDQTGGDGGAHGTFPDFT